MLDDLPVERERGITVKARPLSLVSNTPGEPPFLLNLVDTPGHSDFYGEVTRNLRAVEGAILLVDATQGIQAQTVAAYRAAQESGCVVVPCLNKVDLPHAEVPRWRAEVAALTGTKEADVFELSAKTGAGVEDLLNALPYLLPPPETTLSSEDDAAAAAADATTTITTTASSSWQSCFFLMRRLCSTSADSCAPFACFADASARASRCLAATRIELTTFTRWACSIPNFVPSTSYAKVTSDMCAWR
ncbi:translation factor GUF1 [Pycnococcus provasolii]